MEKTEEIIKLNKLIADFMGKPYDYLVCDACWKINPELDNPESGSRVTKCCPRSIGNYGKTLRPYEADANKFEYHSSWDWLMPVVEKISTTTIKGHLPFKFDQFVRVEIVPNGFVKISNLRDTPIFTNVSIEGGLISATYKAVVKFIKWHNSSNPLT